MSKETDTPVHPSLVVFDTEKIYRTEEWWKAVVRYGYDSGDQYDETAVYLQHNDDDWSRKNKYTIKTTDGWETDKAVVNRVFSGELSSPAGQEFPVSDYYEVGAGETVFQSGDWWKAIVKIVQKGSYETKEAIIYLWEKTDGEWRRRQKYAIKSEEKWQEERTAVESVLGTRDSNEQGGNGQGESTETGVEEFDQLERELEEQLRASMND